MVGNSLTLPCVTPAITLSHSECLLLHFILCFLPLRYWAIQDVSHDGRILPIFVSKILWSTFFLLSKLGEIQCWVLLQLISFLLFCCFFHLFHSLFSTIFCYLDFWSGCSSFYSLNFRIFQLLILKMALLSLSFLNKSYQTLVPIRQKIIFFFTNIFCNLTIKILTYELKNLTYKSSRFNTEWYRQICSKQVIFSILV